MPIPRQAPAEVARHGHEPESTLKAAESPESGGLAETVTYTHLPTLPTTLSIQGLPGYRFPIHRVYCIGQNYYKHCAEMGGEFKHAPWFFQKAPDGIVTDGGDIRYPMSTKLFHHEVELVVALGADPSQPGNVGIFGYAIGLDMTRRDLQMEEKRCGLPWATAKSFDGCGAVSEIVPASHVKDLYDHYISLTVNGELRQRGHLTDMIHKVDEILATLNALFILRPGDLVFTGTPEGVNKVERGDVLVAKLEGFVGLETRIV